MKSPLEEGSDTSLHVVITLAPAWIHLRPFSKLDIFILLTVPIIKTFLVSYLGGISHISQLSKCVNSLTVSNNPLSPIIPKEKFSLGFFVSPIHSDSY